MSDSEGMAERLPEHFYRSMSDPLRYRHSATKPKLEWRTWMVSKDDELILTLGQLGAMCVLTLVAYLFQAVFHAIGMEWFLIAIAIGVFAVAYPRKSTIAIFGCLLFPLILYSFSFSSQLATVVIVVMVALLFAKHFCYYATAAPVPREVAEPCRNYWTADRLLRLAGAFPIILLFHPIATPLGFVEQVISFFSYNAHGSNAPGTFESPAGPWLYRVLLFAASVTVLAAVFFPLLWSLGVNVALDSYKSSSLSESTPIWSSLGKIAGIIVVAVFLPATIILAATFVISAPMIPSLRRLESERFTEQEAYDAVTSEMRQDPALDECVFGGFNQADETPIFTHRSSLAHSLLIGPTGSGKTTLLCQKVEQLIDQGCSVSIADMKGHELTLFESSRLAAERAGVPFRFVTNELNRATHLFSPLHQSNRRQLTRLQLVDLLCSALGMQHTSIEYGPGWFSSANVRVLWTALNRHPNVRNFRELVLALEDVLQNSPKYELPDKVKEAGLHVLTTFQRLAELEVLNGPRQGAIPQSVLDGAIDLGGEDSIFLKPQVHYLYLPTTISRGEGGDIARMYLYYLLTAGALVDRTKERVPVFACMDEFQMIVSSNLKQFFQQARSIGLSMILANQSTQDLVSHGTNLLPTVESNCHFRRWFGAQNVEDLNRVQTLVGQQAYLTTSHSSNSETIRYSETVRPRLSVDELLEISNDPKLSLVQIMNSGENTPMGGTAFVASHVYHVTKEENDRRFHAPWPEPNEHTITQTLDDETTPTTSVEPDDPLMPRKRAKSQTGSPRKRTKKPNPLDDYLKDKKREDKSKRRDEP